MHQNSFSGLTSNSQYLANNNYSMNNFNTAFRNNYPLIEKTDYKNSNILLHNNVGDNILDETVVEYRVYIDSLDRDITAFPDPFSFTVKFNPPSSSSISKEYLKDGKLKIIKDTLHGPPSPHINKEFSNVKYVKLENVILPQHSNIIREECIETSDSTLEYKEIYNFDPCHFLLNDRFVSISIPELESNRTFTTADSGDKRVDDNNCLISTPPRPFALIFPDKIIGKNYYMGCPHNSTKIYKNCNLANINQLTIKFFDSIGRQLKFHHLWNCHDLQKAEKHGCELPICDLRHPLNKRIQTHLTFVIGVVESQINTNPKFEY